MMCHIKSTVLLMNGGYVHGSSTRGLLGLFFSSHLSICIRESVDSLCRDDADMPKPPYKRKACNLPNVAFVSLFREIIVILQSHSTQQHSYSS